MDRDYDVTTVISKYILKGSRVANFADIIKIATMFIKTILRNSNELKRIRNYISKCDLYLYLDITNIADFRLKKADVSRTKGVYQVIYIFFGYFFGVRYNSAKFHHCRICVTEAFLAPSIGEQL